MTRRAGLLVMVVVAACVAEDELENDASEETDASLDDEESVEAREDAAPELASQDDPALGPKCTYVEICERTVQELQPTLVCPPLEPWYPWDPPDPDLPPLEPWTPLGVEPELGRISTGVAPVADFPWPPPGCHFEVVPVDVVHEVECRNRCSAAGTEDCRDTTSGELWTHEVIERPAEFVDCSEVARVPCNSVNVCYP